MKSKVKSLKEADNVLTRTVLLLSLVWIACMVQAQNVGVSGLNGRQFRKYWKVESESPDYEVSFLGDTVEIVSPKGLTLWRKEKMSGKVTIEYDACVVVENEKDRLSDLNCFWMASDPKHPDNIWKREKWRSGFFANCYSLQLYYLGYGGNYNSTTRFRRYTGNEEGITDVEARPAVWCEYTDSAHLLKPNHWYHIKITNDNNRVSYYIDGKRLVDFRDPQPLCEGWFGFRTTLSRTRITNFRYESSPLQPQEVPLHWVGNVPQEDKPVSFGIPFAQGELMSEQGLELRAEDGKLIPADTWPLACWPDGSVKWSGVGTVIPAGASKLFVAKTGGKSARRQPGEPCVTVKETPQGIQIATGEVTAFIPRQGAYLLDSLFYPALGWKTVWMPTSTFTGRR